MGVLRFVSAYRSQTCMPTHSDFLLWFRHFLMMRIQRSLEAKEEDETFLTNSPCHIV